MKFIWIFCSLTRLQLGPPYYIGDLCRILLLIVFALMKSSLIYIYIQYCVNMLFDYCSIYHRAGTHYVSRWSQNVGTMRVVSLLLIPYVIIDRMCTHEILAHI